MAIKEYSTFPKATALLDPWHQDTRWWSLIPSEQMQSVYSATTTDWATKNIGLYSAIYGALFYYLFMK